MTEPIDRQRAESFGGVADLYERFRPTYPPEVIDLVVADLDAGPVTNAVDVGCGTGKAAVLVAARGVGVTGIEPDARMAEIARRYGITVEVGRFEDWRPEPSDVVYSATAWHWVETDRGLDQAAATLRPGGRFFAFWNRERPDDPTMMAIEAIHERLEPSMAEPNPPEAEFLRGQELMATIAAHPEFGEGTIRSVDWHEDVSLEVMLGRFETYSGHIMLPPDRRRALIEAIRSELGPDRSTPLSIRRYTIGVEATRH